MNTKNLILLHGALGSKKQLEKIKGALSKNFQVHTLNFSGHGTNTSEADFSMQTFGRDVQIFMAERGISIAAFFGYSMGGYVALYLAAQEPDLVDAIVTYGTKFHWTAESAAKEVKMLDPDIIEAKVPSFAEQLKRVHGPGRWKGVLVNTAQMMQSLGAQPVLDQKALGQINRPVLISIGTEDRMVSIEESRETAGQLSKGQLKILTGFTHPIEKNDPAAMAMMIQAFLK